MDASARQSFGNIDPVTHLPNRRQFIDRFISSPPGGFLVMVTLADAAHFNHLLHAVGHDYAENFVCAGAARVRDLLPADTELYHTSALSVAFMVESDPEPVAAKLAASFVAPLVCGGIPIATKIGIGLVPCERMNGLDLLRAALVAAQNSRESAAGYAFYNYDADILHRRRFLLLSQIPDALRDDNQLSLDFQPKFDFRTGLATGAEALIRWQHPRFGAVSPAEFIPLIEATALIEPLTDWVVEHALAQLLAWHADGYYYTVAINVSPQSLTHGGFAAKMLEVVQRYRIDPSFIELEFTESALSSQSTTVAAELKALRDNGSHVALDDFGTGFSNLSYMANLPADIIKIDQTFIRNIQFSERSAVVVRELIGLAHQLKYRVVAEGIETAECHDLLSRWNCDEGQGYFLSAPLSKAALSRWMHVQQPVKAKSLSKSFVSM